ncbi:glycosyltransferase family 9 protein [Dialister succinatiphilus]|uniref:glycosyltransferase family 9 protein n=1 Tax=Dialister succinatiphilus TaxID=487173 RepID=UPI002354D4B7|nr:glycosyltransferase family 9 protein [Dialister succinatiphilus]
MKERNNKLMKKMDRYIGCPLLFGLGLFHKKRKFAPYAGKNPSIALLKTAAMGDTILMEAVIQEIRADYPDSKITFICSKSNLGMTKALSGIDRVFEFKMKNPLASLAQARKLGHFDYLFDFAPWARINALISYCMDADFKVGFKRKGMHRHYIYDKAVVHSDDVHEVENYRNILRAAGMDIHSYNPHFAYSGEPILDGKYVVFHLYPAGSSTLLRMWDKEKWVELGKRIYKKYGYTILLSGGKEDAADADGVVSRLQAAGVKAMNGAGRYNLKEMENILGHAEFLVSVNTGIMHMGAAVGVPLIALHGATSVKRWGPLSDRARNIWTHEKCQPCISLGFESKCKDPICMKHITVDMVMDEIVSMEEANGYKN